MTPPGRHRATREKGAGTLVIAAHGTRSGTGLASIERLRQGVGRHWAGPVRVGFVDVCEPRLAEVLTAKVLTAEAGAARPPVVVPLFLALGRHATDDIVGAAEGAPGARIAQPLARAPGLVDLLVAAVPADATGIVLAAAGSQRPEARDGVARLAVAAGERRGLPAAAAFLSGPGPRLADAVECLTAPRATAPSPAQPRLTAPGPAAHDGAPGLVAIVGALLAPGHFAARLEEACREGGFAVPSAPLLEREPDRVAGLVAALGQEASD